MSNLRDTADWSDVQLRSIDVGASSRDRYVLHGYHYVNEMELMLARLLWDMRIPFTPDVPFILDLPPYYRRRKRQFVPDFILDRAAYVWHEEGRKELIHGIEAKGAPNRQFSVRAQENVRLLREQRGIRVKLLNHKDIVRCVRRGGLPITLLLP